MNITVRAMGRAAILASLTAIIIIAAIIIEILVDNLTNQTRDLQHLLKHSLGNIGTMMALLSLAGYMIKKNWRSFPGMLKDWLFVHQWFATAGGVLIAVHSGAHFNAALPVITFIFLLVCLVSGFVGRYVFLNAQKELSAKRSDFISSGLSREEAEEKLTFATATAKALSKWRAFHRPFAASLGLFLLLHIVSALFFGG